MRDVILDTLTANSGLCMDIEEERESLCDALMEAFGYGQMVNGNVTEVYPPEDKDDINVVEVAIEVPDGAVLEHNDTVKVIVPARPGDGKTQCVEGVNLCLSHRPKTVCDVCGESMVCYCPACENDE